MNSHNAKPARTRSLLSACILSVLGMTTVAAQPISGIYMLGDSGSDAGVLGGLKPTNQGNVWFETLSYRLGYPSKPAYLTDPANNGENFLALGDYVGNGGNDYAVSGGTIVATPTQNVTLADEVSVLLHDHAGRLDSRALILIEMGPNDIPQMDTVSGGLHIASPEFLDQAAKAYAQQVRRLQTAGAKNIVALTALDYSLAPVFVNAGYPDLLALLNDRTQVLNAALRRELAGTGVYVVDYGKMGTELVANYAKYGFSVGNAGSICPGTGSSPCDQPNDGHVFADLMHASSAAQTVLADYIQAQLRARDQFAGLLTQQMTILRQESAALEPALDSAAAFGNIADDPAPRRAIGSVTAFAGGDHAQVNSASTGGTDPGLDSRGNGGQVGADVLLGSNLLVGGRLHHAQAKGTFGADTGGYRGDTTAATAYGVLAVTPRARVNLALTYGYVDFTDISRKAHVGSTAVLVAKGSTNGHYAAVRLGGAYDFVLRDWIFTPTAALAYERMKIDSYSEGDGVLAMAFGTSAYDALRTSLGLNVAWAGGGLGFRPYARASLEHDLKSSDIGIKAGPDAHLLGDYAISRPDKTFVQTSAGADFQLTRGVTLNVNAVRVLPRDGRSNWSVGSELRVRF